MLTNTVRPIPSRAASMIATRRWITPTASSRLIRRQHGFCDSPTRLAICSIGRAASCWSSSRIRRSIESIFTIGRLPESFSPTNLPDPRSFWEEFEPGFADLCRAGEAEGGSRHRRDPGAMASAYDDPQRFRFAGAMEGIPEPEATVAPSVYPGIALAALLALLAVASSE